MIIRWIGALGKSTQRFGWKGMKHQRLFGHWLFNVLILFGSLCLSGCGQKKHAEVTSMQKAQWHFNQGQYDEAWQALRQSPSHADMQYLAGYMHFFGHGVSTDRTLAQACFSQAARQGHPRAKEALDIIDRYQQSHLPKPLPSFPQTTRRWGCSRWAQDPQPGYVLQLAIFSNQTYLTGFCRRYHHHHLQFYTVQRQDRSQYHVIMGPFHSRQEAQQALSRLPLDLQRLKPFIKSISNVNKDLS